MDLALLLKSYIMTHTYNIQGMTCGGCVAKAKSELLKIGDVVEANVQLTSPHATIVMEKHIPISELQKALAKAGNYTITEERPHHIQSKPASQVESTSWIETYKPIVLIGIYITGITLLIESFTGKFSLHSWMQNFMAGFFLVFSFFKLLNLRGFADSYSTYDIIARRWYGWGFVYAFIELFLGVGFLTGFKPVLVNAITLVVMTVSIIGVIQSVLNKKKIQCACLGAVFNLPMSTVTIIEDALMIIMSAVMLTVYLV